jgi:amino-acid N-acetyltransferase
MKEQYNQFIYRSATVEDVDGIFKLVNSMAESGQMLRRSKYRIVTMLANFIVATFKDGDSAEIAALAVVPRFQSNGVGHQLVQELLRQAQTLGFPEVITLTYAVDFFSELGFSVQSKDRFPRKLWRECLECPRLEDCDEIAMSIRLDR